MSNDDGATVAVTGGAGFLGLNLVRRFAADGRRVVALHHSPLDGVARSVAADLGDRVRFVDCDVRDERGLAKALADHAAHAVVHAAAITTPASFDGLALLDVNLRVAQCLLELARGGMLGRIVVVSSAAVFRSPPSEAPLPEEAPVTLHNPYSITKFAAERLVAYYRNEHGIDATAVRLPGLYGPFERPTTSRTAMSAVFRAVEQARQGAPIIATGAEVGRDWTHAADVADGISLLVTHPAPVGELYHLGIGRNYTTRETLAVITDLIPGTLVRWTDNPQEANVPVAAARSAPLAIERARLDLGFVPRFPLREGIAAYLAHLNDHPEEMPTPPPPPLPTAGEGERLSRPRERGPDRGRYRGRNPSSS